MIEMSDVRWRVIALSKKDTLFSPFSPWKHRLWYPLKAPHWSTSEDPQFMSHIRKRTFWYVRWTKTHISLCISAVWPEFLVWRNVISLAIQNASSEDSDQTARMCRLIWIFAGRTCQKVHFQTLSWVMCFCKKKTVPVCFGWKEKYLITLCRAMMIFAVFFHKK